MHSGSLGPARGAASAWRLVLPGLPVDPASYTKRCAFSTAASRNRATLGLSRRQSLDWSGRDTVTVTVTVTAHGSRPTLTAVARARQLRSREIDDGQTSPKRASQARHLPGRARTLPENWPDHPRLPSGRGRSQKPDEARLAERSLSTLARASGSLGALGRPPMRSLLARPKSSSWRSTESRSTSWLLSARSWPPRS